MGKLLPFLPPYPIEPEPDPDAIIHNLKAGFSDAQVEAIKLELSQEDEHED